MKMKFPLPVRLSALTLALAAFAPIASADVLTCLPVNEKAGAEVKLYKERTLQRLTTDVDETVGAICKPWSTTDALDRWHYADYTVLYDAKVGKKQKDGEAFVKANPQPKVERKVCFDQRHIAGAYAFTEGATVAGHKLTAKLHMLCTLGSTAPADILNRGLELAIKPKLENATDTALLEVVSEPVAAPLYNSLALECAEGGKRYTAVVTKDGVIEPKLPRFYKDSRDQWRRVVWHECQTMAQFNAQKQTLEGLLAARNQNIITRFAPLPESTKVANTKLPEITLAEIMKDLAQ